MVTFSVTVFRSNYVVALLLIAVCRWYSPAGLAADGAAKSQPTLVQNPGNPWYPDLSTPPLKTPLWTGESDLDAVITLAIDDMRDPAAYEAYLRPLLIRLKQIDGRAPVSIMTCAVNPESPQLQSWLGEGLSLEVHTTRHPCPLLQQNDFAAARETVAECIDLLCKIPGNTPVAYRMPCCDSLNTVSPRFFSEIFTAESPDGHRLKIDSSVFQFFTSRDPQLSRDRVLETDGTERFLKYKVRHLERGSVTHREFFNAIYNYPYPYRLASGCWEFPCVAPSDWSAQHHHGPNNEKTIEDWKAALDLTVEKQGVMNLVFHPHGWITAEQLVDFVDYADKRYGRRVRFMTFREAAACLEKTFPATFAENNPSAENTSKSSPLIQSRPALLPASLKQLQGVTPQNTRWTTVRTEDGPVQVALTTRGEQTQLLFRDASKEWRPIQPAAATLSPVTNADGTDAGFFFGTSDAGEPLLCWINESTWRLPNLCHSIALLPLLKNAAEAQTKRPPKPTAMIPVGSAVRDITPTTPVRLTGYAARKEETSEIASRLHARVLILGGPTDGASTASTAGPQEAAILITVDNCGVPLPVSQRLTARLSERYAIPASRIAISSTHTHSAPWLQDFAPWILTNLPEEHAAHLDMYETYLEDQVFAAVGEAWNNRCPATLWIGHGTADFARNRRALANGQWQGFGVEEGGPVDHRVSVLSARDEDGQTIALLVNYACHATTETGQLNSISGDWPGYAATALEKACPGATALIAVGCGADSNPFPRGTNALAQQHGQALATAVQHVLSPQSPFPMQPLSSAIQCRRTNVELPLGPLPTREEWEQRAMQGGAAGHHARRHLEMIEAGIPIPPSIPDYPVQTWTFGDELAMVFLAGEVVIDYSLRLSTMLDRSRLWINAYANDVPCYIASQRILREGGYEADSSMYYYARPTRLAPEAEDIIVDTVQKLLPHDFYTQALRQDFPGPQSVSEALTSFQVPNGYSVRLVAAEPLIRDPVAFDWDELGRLWVVEMGDYPLSDEAGGRVRLLTDTDRDGTYDRAVTFLDGLRFPSGICRWRDGVLITAAPDVLYAADTNNDGVCDFQKVLITGFSEGNQQHRVNGLRWGLDGSLHLGNGDSGGQLKVVGTTGPPRPSSANTNAYYPISGRDVAFHPDSGVIRTTTGQTQFGRSRDDFGNWFGNNNSNPIWHYLYSPAALDAASAEDLPAARYPIAEIGGAAPVFPTSRTLARFNDFDRANRFTSACSTAIYRDHTLGKDLYGDAFICEPVHNLVSRLKLTSNGPTFRAARAESELQSEFFSSSDNWCRPVMVRTGPDGGLYIADMYRQVIEHPQWIPAEFQRKLDLQAGTDRGRIWKIVRNDVCCPDETESQDLTPVPELPADTPTETAPRTFFPQAHEISVTDLLDKAASPNGWWRDTAQRLLSHRPDWSTAVTTHNLTTHPDPAVRIQGLAIALQSENQSATTWESALNDSDARVRAAAVRLLGARIFQLEGRSPALRLLTDAEDVVVFRTLLLLLNTDAKQLAAELAPKDISPALQAIIGDPDRHPEVRRAARMAVTSDMANEIIRTASRNKEYLSDAQALRDFQYLWARAESRLVDQYLKESLQFVLPADVAFQPDDRKWAEYFRLIPDAARRIAESVPARQRRSLFEQCLRAWRDAIETNTDSALHALQLGCLFAEPMSQELLSEIRPEIPAEAQQMILRELAAGAPEATALIIIERWNQLSPTVRQYAEQLLLSSRTGTRQFMAALPQTIRPMEVSAATAQRLLMSPDPEIRNQARKVLAAVHSDESVEITPWLAACEATDIDAEAGRPLFRKHCSACHRLDDVGVSVGPDLAALADRSTAALLTAVLNPNQAVEAKYLAYTAVLKSGQIRNGLIHQESDKQLVLALPDGKLESIQRSDLESLQATRQSLMPEGFGKQVSKRDLAALIRYVQSAGHSQNTLRPDADGVIELPAEAADLSGPSIRLEDKYGNLGWWSSEDDLAAWNVEVPSSGHWTVRFDYACDKSCGGNQLRIATGTRMLTARVADTGSWDNYRIWRVGKLDLRRGMNRITIRAAKPPHSAMLDLRNVYLIPPGE